MDKQLKILIDDGNQIKLGTGIGKMSLYLFNAMRDNGYNVSLVPQQETDSSRFKARISYLKKINSSEYARSLKEYDAVIYTNYAMPFRKNKSTLYIVVIADMVSFLYPQTLPRLYRMYSQMIIKNAVKKADLLFTISNSVKKEILSKFPNAADRLRMTWLGLYDGINPLNSYSEYENVKLRNIDSYNYFLFVSTVEKRKNVGFVLEAFINLKQTDFAASDCKLVIVGRPGYGYDEFVEMANSSGFSDDIIFAGYTSDADCNRLYNHARAFVFPTIYEGFGFAQIECMKCHLPIILSDIPTNREISRDYGLFFDLENVDSLVDRMKEIVEGKYNYEEKNQIADMYIQDFQWSTIAEMYYEYISEAIH